MYSPNPLLCMGTSLTLSALLSRIFQASKNTFHTPFPRVLSFQWKSFLVSNLNFPWYGLQPLFLVHCLAPPRTVYLQAVGNIHLLPTCIAVRLPSTAPLPPPQTLEQRRFWQLFDLSKFFCIASDLETQNSRKPIAHRGSCHNSR